MRAKDDQSDYDQIILDMGINIARFSRTSTIVMPATEINQFLQETFRKLELKL